MAEISDDSIAQKIKLFYKYLEAAHKVGWIIFQSQLKLFLKNLFV